MATSLGAALQRSRVYELVIGDDNRSIKITSLNIKFSVTKSADNKENKNKATVEIYNLSRDIRKYLEESLVRVQLSVGYLDTGVTPLFAGEVVDIKERKVFSKRENTNLVTTIELDEFYSAFNSRVVSKTTREGVPVKDVILTLLEDMPEVVRYEMHGENLEKRLIDGFQVQGSPKQVLDRLCRENDLEWQIDGGVLRVADKYGSYMKDTSRAPLIGQMSGLIGRPEYVAAPQKRSRKSATKENGKEESVDNKSKDKGKPKKKVIRDHLKVMCLLNPSIGAGGFIKLEFEDMTGFYKVEEVRHYGEFRGNDWYSELTLSNKV